MNVVKLFNRNRNKKIVRNFHNYENSDFSNYGNSQNDASFVHIAICGSYIALSIYYLGSDVYAESENMDICNVNKNFASAFIFWFVMGLFARYTWSFMVLYITHNVGKAIYVEHKNKNKE